MNGEAWRVVPNFPMYEASSRGRVRSVGQGRGRRRGHVMSQRLGSRGIYLEVDLAPGGGRKTKVNVHRLVGEAFLGPRPDGMQTRHLDGNATNNNVENLAYGTPWENAQDSIRHGTHYSIRQAARTRCAAGHPYSQSNTRILPDGRRACRACDVAKSIRWQKRELDRKESRGEVTTRMIRSWASSLELTGNFDGRLPGDIKWLFAYLHPEFNWVPTPDPRRQTSKPPTFEELITRNPEWADRIETRTLRTA